MADIAELLWQAIAAWNRGDRGAYLEIYDPAVTFHGAPPGRDGVRRFYERIWRLFPGSTLELDDVIVQGDKLACRYIWRGTNRRTGDVVVPGLTIMHFENGKCTERWDFEGSEGSVT